MATTRSRSRGREHARPSSGGIAAEHATRIYSVAISGIVIAVAFLALTGIGHVIDAATQHFMLFYAGVFALIALCASVGLGLIATDRMFLRPGRRVLVQSAHRAASFGAVTFLLIHIVTEILAQRVHVLDAVIPFLSPFRTFYIGLGTIASDLIILLVITGIMRGRFNANGKAWRWRAIHYASYLSFVFGVWHGLLAGRTGKPYVDWSYGLIVALIAIGLAVRVLSRSLRPRENLSAPPVTTAAASASGPMRAAAMFAQLNAARGAGPSRLALSTAAEPVRYAPAAARSTASPMLTAPISSLAGSRPQASSIPPASSSAGPVLAGGARRGPRYEPGYEGPARYLGAPRDLGREPRSADGPGFWPADEDGSLSSWGSGHRPGAPTGPQPRLPAGAARPQPRLSAGSAGSAGAAGSTGSPARPAASPRPTAGLRPRPGSGPLPRADSGPLPRAATGPQPRVATGPYPRVPWAATGPQPRVATGPYPWAPRAATGPMPAVDSQERWPAPGGPDAGPFPHADPGPGPRHSTGPRPRPGTGTGPLPRAETGPLPLPLPQAGPPPWAQTGPIPRAASGPVPVLADSGIAPGGAGPSRGQAPWDGGSPEPDPDFRYREPGPGMPGYRGSRDHRYGGDVRL